MQYVGSDNNIIDVCHDPLGVSVAVYTDDDDVDVPVGGIPELVEVILAAPEGETDAERIVRFAAMFADPAGTLIPPPVGALRLTLAFLHRAAKHRDYEAWSLADCQAVSDLLFDIDAWARQVRPHLT